MISLQLALRAAETGDPDDVLVMGDALEEELGAGELDRPGGLLGVRVLTNCVRRRRTAWKGRWFAHPKAVVREFRRRLRHPHAFSTRANRRLARAVAAVLLFGEWSTEPWPYHHPLWDVNGSHLDFFGRYLGLQRTQGEPDDAFRRRLNEVQAPGVAFEAGPFPGYTRAPLLVDQVS